MSQLRLFITEGLELRSNERVKVRQPLANVSIHMDFAEELKEILGEELNVKDVSCNYNQKESIILDFEITPELKLEGEMREVIRAIQEGRKKAGFNVEDRIVLGYTGKEEVFAVHQDEIAREVLATEVSNGELSGAEYTNTVDIDGSTYTFWLKRA